jgi:hypothetical protein
MRVLSFDPGRELGASAGTGWCYQDPAGVKELGVTKNLHEFLRGLYIKEKPVDVIVVEEYEVRAGTVAQNIGIKLVPVQNIGAVRFYAYLINVPVVEQYPRQKPTMAKATGVNPKKFPKAIEHQYDAYNHGRYYLIQKNLAKSKLELDMEAKGEI